MLFVVPTGNEVPTTLLRTENRLTLHYPARRHGSFACYLGSFLCVFRPWIVFLFHLKFHETRNIYIVHLFQNLQILFCCHTHLGEITSKFPILSIHIAVFTLDRAAGKTPNFKSTESIFGHFQSLVKLNIRLLLKFHSYFKIDPLCQRGNLKTG